MRCREVRRRLPALADEASLPNDVAEHLAQCLRCRADLARYRRLQRTIRQLRATPVGIPPGRVAALLASLDERVAASDERRRGRRVAWSMVAASGATMVVTGGVVAVAARRRRR